VVDVTAPSADTTSGQNEDEREWPALFPPGCPPGDANPANGSYYYLVINNPPNSEDMKSASERGVFLGEDECERASLSCWSDVASAKGLKSNVPRLRGTYIAKFRLEPKHGMIKQTRSPSHHSLWLRAQYHASSQKLLEVL
jgi:hypothetical protein